mgnify:CR=1 FL=1
MKLYELAEEFSALFTELEENEGELTPELAGRLTRISQDFDAKVENIALFILQLESDAAQIKEEIFRLESRHKSTLNKANWLRSYLLLQMENAERNKIESSRVTVSTQKSPPAVIVENTEIIPSQFKKGQLKLRWDEIPEFLRDLALVEVDKTAIKESFNQGRPVPGVRLESKLNLRIR